MTGMRLPIACPILSLFNFDAPALRIHQRDCLIMLALCDEPENAFRPSLHTRRNQLVTCYHRQSVKPPSRRFFFQFDSLKETGDFAFVLDLAEVPQESRNG